MNWNKRYSSEIDDELNKLIQNQRINDSDSKAEHHLDMGLYHMKKARQSPDKSDQIVHAFAGRAHSLASGAWNLLYGHLEDNRGVDTPENHSYARDLKEHAEDLSDYAYSLSRMINGEE